MKIDISKWAEFCFDFKRIADAAAGVAEAEGSSRRPRTPSANESVEFDNSRWGEFVVGFQSAMDASKGWRLLHTPRANYFLDLAVDFRERVHVRFLRWLLDPAGSHELQDLFLRAFLTEFSASADTHFARSLPAPQIIREFHGVVDSSPCRVDLVLLWPKQLAVFIEEKVLASEQRDQLSRYARILIQNTPGLSKDDRILLFITPDGRKASTMAVEFESAVSFRAVAAHDLAQLMYEAVSREPQASPLVARLIRDYVALSSRLKSRLTNRRGHDR